MPKMRNIYLAVSVVIPVILGCNFLSGGLPTGGDVQGTSGRETSAPGQSGEGSGFGSIIFSQDVTDEG